MAKYDSHHPKLPNNPSKTNWVERAGHLPSAIDAVARALKAKGYPTGRAIATAVNHVRKVCSTGRAFGGKTPVSAEARTKACAAAAQWEAMKARAKADTSIPVDERRAIELAFKRIEGDALRIDMARNYVRDREGKFAETGGAKAPKIAEPTPAMKRMPDDVLYEEREDARKRMRESDVPSIVKAYSEREDKLDEEIVRRGLPLSYRAFKEKRGKSQRRQ